MATRLTCGLVAYLGGEPVGWAVEGYPIVAQPEQKIIWDEASVGTPQVFAAAGLEQVSSPTVRRRVMRLDFC